MELGVAMIGCEQQAGVQALVQRFGAALRRVTPGRPVGISVTHGSSPLGDAASAGEALQRAEQLLDGERLAEEVASVHPHLLAD